MNKSFLLLGFFLLLGCSSDKDPSGGQFKNCGVEILPLPGEPNAPTLIDASLECQGNYLNLFATAEDPQGDADLMNVSQTIGVFQDADCQAVAREVTDDFAGSGIEESFGIVFQKPQDEAVFARICAADRWPIEVQLRDAGGHTTTGRVLARVIH